MKKLIFFFVLIFGYNLWGLNPSNYVSKKPSRVIQNEIKPVTQNKVKIEKPSLFLEKKNQVLYILYV